MSEQEMIDELQFTCPECGCHEYERTWSGKGDRNDPATWNGLCHGAVKDPMPDSRVICYRSCRFTWEGKDDAKYFKPTGRKYPRVCEGQCVVPGTVPQPSGLRR